ncbi:MAG: hypothetical protein J5855_09300 [Mailhella sp.]|nr:hypothetical protein [Mailhella sp.]
MTPVFLLYLAVLSAIAFFARSRVRTFSDFVIAGGRQGAFWITLSTLAGIVGGSATFGIMTLAAKHGFAAFWWLGAGSIFLILQGLLVSERARALDVSTLPELAGKTAGRQPRVFIALVIAISWTGIIAAQFSALESLFTPLLPESLKNISLFLVSFTVIVYTAAGGQISVLRTDALQFAILMIGVLFTCAWLWRGGDPAGQITLSAGSFARLEFTAFLLVTGLPYFLGPDLLSRGFSARDGKTARRSATIAAVVLFFFAVPMALIGVWAKENGISANPLPVIISEYVPAPLGCLLFLGLISALISSADTCLLSVASIVENDLIGGSNIRRTRVILIAAGAISAGIAFFRKDVTGLLLSAYSVYVPGVVFPLFTCLMFASKRPVSRNLVLTGMAAGSALGAASVCLDMPACSLAGMGASALFSAAAVCVPGRGTKTARS